LEGNSGLAALATGGTAGNASFLASGTASATRRRNNQSNFDGFLKAFLGGEQTSGKTSRSRGGTPSGAPANGKEKSLGIESGRQDRKKSIAKAVSNLTSAEKRTLRQALSKTISRKGEADPRPLSETDEPLAEAAEKAAQIIFDLLYPVSGETEEAAADAPEMSGILAVMHMLGPGVESQGIAALTPGLSANIMGEAMETANASAEMNIGAVLAALEELYDGLPQQMLDQAMYRNAGSLGLAAAQATMSEKNAGQESGKNGEAVDPVEIDMHALEQSPDAKIDSGRQISDVPRPVSMSDNILNNNGLIGNQSGDGNALGGQSGKSGEKGESSNSSIFPAMKGKMEYILQSSQNTDSAGQVDSVPAASSSFPAASIGADAATGTGEGANSGASIMLDRLKNIEQLAEAMKMGSRGGVKNLTLLLSPPELGKVMLRMESRNGMVSAWLRTEKPEAVNQLIGSLRDLRQNLKAQGIELGELDIRQQSDPGTGGFDGQRRRERHETGNDIDGKSGGGRYAVGKEDETPEAAAAASPEMGNDSVGGGLNLVA
jgi:flagellar hook-length control protein FliK